MGNSTELCLYCGKSKPQNMVYSQGNQKICDDCLHGIFKNHAEFYTEQGVSKPERKALEKICMILNLYYSDLIVDHLKHYYSEIAWKREIENAHLVESYIGYVNSKYNQKFKVYMKSYEDTILERFQGKNIQNM